MKINDIAKKMMDLGFTQYEARVYVCLLQNNPATGYEISKKSGVPRSAIYDVMQRLETYGAVSAISDKPKKFAPLPPDQFVELLQNQFKNKVEKFHDSISHLQEGMETEYLWSIHGYTNMILKAKELINTATEEIYLSGWRWEILQLEAELRAAEKRGVKIVMFSFTKVPQVGIVFSYNLNEREMEQVWDHKIILIRDREEVLMGEANRKEPRKVAWTHNKGIVMIAANQIVLDITLYGQRMGRNIDEAVIEAHPGELELLDSLLRKAYPDAPWAQAISSGGDAADPAGSQILHSEAEVKK